MNSADQIEEDKQSAAVKIMAEFHQWTEATGPCPIGVSGPWMSRLGSLCYRIAKAEGHMQFLSELFRECPHAEIHFNDDADQEPWPVGYTIHCDGCSPLTVTRPTLAEAIDAFRAASNQEDGHNG